MNKRKYPYGIDMCPQLKIHISDKQIAGGVLNASKMSEIYGKESGTHFSYTSLFILITFELQ